MSITNSPIRISRSFKTGGTLLTDNNSWNRDGGHAARVFSANGGMWYAEGGNDDIHVTHITDGDEALHVNCAVLGPKLVEGAQRDLGIDFSKRVANKEDYRLIRIATPTLWDSLAVTILRHAVQAGKAQHSIKKLREHMGEKSHPRWWHLLPHAHPAAHAGRDRRPTQPPGLVLLQIRPEGRRRMVSKHRH